MILETINWFIYLFVYINITNPRFLYYKNKDTEKIINRIHKLTKLEIEYVIKGCILYDKSTHKPINPDELLLSELSRLEIINLIGYSLFALEINDIQTNINYPKIIELCNKIENELGYLFKENNNDRYLFRKWGSNYINFNFRHLIMQFPIRLIINSIHYYFQYKLNFKYTICKKTKISYLYKINDNTKKNLIFIHGFGFGYIPYIFTLFKLQQNYNVIIIVLPNISSYSYYDDINYSYFPKLKEIRDSIYNFIYNNNINESILLSHSFGTYITQLLRKDNRVKIFNKIILIDPIIFWIGCFKMSLYVDNPFIRKYPLYEYIYDNLINFLIYQCIYLKYVCYRVMFGPDFWIYDSIELNNSNVIIILEKNDHIIPAELLYNKINSTCKCIYINESDANHGSILMNDKYYNKLIEIIDNE
jgi:hypothetical protein